MLYCGAVVSVAFNGSKALLADLSVIKPTMFLGVPKVYENVRDAVQRKMVGFKKTLFERAMAAKIADLDTGCGYSKIWDILVFSKTKQRSLLCDGRCANLKGNVAVCPMRPWQRGAGLRSHRNVCGLFFDDDV